MTFAAVVVSYNRIDLLKKCLVALESQTEPLDEIIVVENGSTDGSADYVRENHPGVTLFETGKNLGGAGGFAWGLDISMAKGHEAAWLMDDDAEPELDAFAPLKEAFGGIEPRPSVLASLVTNGRDVFNTRNPPVITTDAKRHMDANAVGGVAIDTATFVGVLVNLDLARETHLPFVDFFIWIDDSEYTHRLSRMGLAMTVPASMVNHPVAKGTTADMGPRLYYHIRNNLWYLREKEADRNSKIIGLAGLAIQTLEQALKAENKLGWASAAARGWFHGATRRPRRIAPGGLVETLPQDGRQALGIHAHH